MATRSTWTARVYMYFTLQELLEGIFVHVGLHKLDWLDRDTITDLMTACATWPKEGDAIQEAARLTAQIESLQQARTKDASTIDTLKNQLAITSQKLADTTAKLSRFLSEEKPVEDKKQPKGESKIVSKGDIAQKSERKPIEPTVTIPYSEAVYQSLMLPLTIDKTGLPTRVLSIMKMVGGSSNATVGDALTHPKKEFEKIRGFGKGVAEKLDMFIESHHLAYGMNVEEIMMKHTMQNNPNLK